MGKGAQVGREVRVNVAGIVEGGKKFAKDGRRFSVRGVAERRLLSG